MSFYQKHYLVICNPGGLAKRVNSRRNPLLFVFFMQFFIVIVFGFVSDSLLWNQKTLNLPDTAEVSGSHKSSVNNNVTNKIHQIQALEKDICYYKSKSPELNFQGYKPEEDLVLDPIGLLRKSRKTITYVPNEVILKLKQDEANSHVNSSSSKTSGIPSLQSNDVLGQIKTKFKVMEYRSVLNTEAAKFSLPSAFSKKSAAPKSLPAFYKLKVELKEDQTIQDVIRFCSQLPEMEYADLNYTLSINRLPNDPNFAIQWHLNNIGQIYPVSGRDALPPGTPDSDIDAPEIWDFATGSKDVVIAVIDTGIDYTHPDLIDNLWINKIEMNGEEGVDDDGNGYKDDIYGYNFVKDTGNPRDDHGHGTHCAGIIAARGNNSVDLTGVCWSASIMGLKFLDSGGSGTTEDAIKAIQYAIDNGADVISNSWGSPAHSQALEDMMAYAHQEGLMIVASAGNEGSDSPQYPSSYESVFSVAASDSNDDIASFSSFGPTVDLAAPGVDILSLRADRTALGTLFNETTTIASGTSMACPVVAGACGLLLTIYPDLTNDQIGWILKTTGDPIEQGWITSNARLNAHNAANALFGHVQFDSRHYSCTSEIQVLLLDLDLTGQPVVPVTIQTQRGDDEDAACQEIETSEGCFKGIIYAEGGEPIPHDGILQLVHNESMTVFYGNERDISGNSSFPSDSIIADCQEPAVSELSVIAPGSIADMALKTDEPAQVRVYIGLSRDDFPIQKTEDSFKTEHAFEIREIQPHTQYYYYVEAVDQAGNITRQDNNGQCFTFITTSALGEIIVPDDYPTIQAAIDRAWDRDVITLQNGTYAGEGNIEIRFRGKQITLRSISGPERCIVDCDSRGRGFIFQDDPNAVIEGITVQRGYAKTNVNHHVPEYWEGGAGIYSFQSRITLRNCIFRDNFTTAYGGALYADGGQTQILDCTFEKNKAFAGGACSFEGIFQTGQIRIDHCFFSQNEAETEGGGMDFYNSSVIISDTEIRKNRAFYNVVNSYGGGIFLANSSLLTLRQSDISENYADLGGGICAVGSRSIAGANCRISHNQATRGGAAFLSNTRADFVNCFVTLNQADYAAGILQWDRVVSRIENCTYTENLSQGTGGAIASMYDSNSVVINTILWNNNPPAEQIYLFEDELRPNWMYLAYCDIQNDQAAVFDPNSAVLWGPGIIAEDPLFAFADDSHLLSNSSCMDQGTAEVRLLQKTDLDGSPRVIDGDQDGTDKIDIGACEYNPAVPVIALSGAVMRLEGTAEDPAGLSGSFRIRNAGGQVLSWQIFKSADWIQVQPSEGASGGEINEVQMQINTGALSGGEYQMDLAVSDPQAVNNPQKIRIYLHLRGVIHVPGQYPTIQAAIDSAQDGDRILVADGLYRGEGNRDIHFDGKAVQLISENGPTACILDAEGSQEDPHRVFKFYEGGETPETIVDGFTMINGYAGSDFFKIFPPFEGGAVWCGESRPRLRNCIIRDNQAYDTGGGCVLFYVGGPDEIIQFSNCQILRNIAHCNIGNSAGGGGVWGADGLHILNCLFADNQSRMDGGGAWLFGTKETRLLNCTLSHNSALEQGGGIYFLGLYQDPEGYKDTNAEIRNTILWDNTASSGEEISVDYDPLWDSMDLDLAYSIIREPGSTIQVVPPSRLIWKEGNLFSNPLFSEEENGDYHLQMDSPAVDSGTRDKIEGLPAEDIDGQPRLVDADGDGLPEIDIGADEVPAAPFSDPLIEISDWEFDFIAYQGEQNPPSQAVRIRNSGTGTFQWQIPDSCSWMSVSPQNGSLSSGDIIEVTLRPDIAGLLRGTYSCQLAVEAPAAANHPRTFRINLQIFERGRLFVPSDYSSIQEAINAAAEDDMIIVDPGTYEEDINFRGKNITLHSLDPGNWDTINSTILSGTGRKPVITLTGTEQAAQVAGFTITGGFTSKSGAGIQGNNSQASILNCVIQGNRAMQKGGGIHGIRGQILNCVIEKNTAEFGGGLADCNDVFNSLLSANQSDEGGGLYNITGRILHCTIARNLATKGAGLSQCLGRIENCIIWGNEFDSLYQCSQPLFSCVEGDDRGEKNIDIDPEFIDFQLGNYRLSPGSFCIDAGNPVPAVMLETDLFGNFRFLDGDNNGQSIPDMGAYEMPVSEERVIGISGREFLFISPGSDRQILKIWNAGLPPIHYSIEDPNCRWLHINPLEGIVSGEPHEITIRVDPNEVSYGIYQCQVQITDPLAVNNPRTILVRLKVLTNRIYLTPQAATIQDSIDYLMQGGILILADGLYTGPGNRDVQFRGKSIVLRSENGPQYCIIDPNGTPDQPHRALLLNQMEDPNTVIEGITFKHGYSSQGGGAVYCEQASPCFRNCIFVQNRASVDDGGAVLIRLGSPRFEECSFLHNQAETGAGLYIEKASPRIIHCSFTENTAELGGGMFIRNTDPKIRDCTFIGNSAENGGALFLQYSGGEIDGCLFTRNTATFEYWQNGGGAIYSAFSYPAIRLCQFEENSGAWDGGAVLNYRSNLHIEQCRFEKNAAWANDGGALFNLYGSDPNIIRCTFIANQAGSWGGAIRNRQSNPYIENCLFTENYAVDNGGAIFNFLQSSPTIVHSTFSRNSANGNPGGGIYNLNDCECAVYNSILWDNESTEIEDEASHSTVAYNCIEGNAGQYGSANTNLNPRFRDPVRRDYHLLKSSPCIDAALKTDVQEDLEGTLRPWDYPYLNPFPTDSAYDIGAYEFINRRPIADPGPDEIAYADPDGVVSVRLDASDSYDPDKQTIYYRWVHHTEGGHTYYFNAGDHVINLNDLSALFAHWAETGDSYFDISTEKDQYVDIKDLLGLVNNWLAETVQEAPTWQYDLAPSDPNITIQLAVGEHRLELFVNDTIEYSEPNEIRIHVIESIQVPSQIVPPRPKLSNGNQRITAFLYLPCGITADQIDTEYSLRIDKDQPALFFKVLDRAPRLTLLARFKVSQIPAEDQQNKVLQITGKLKSGQYFHTTKQLIQTFR